MLDPGRLRGAGGNLLDHPHHLGAAAEGADRHSATDALGQADHVRLDPEVLGGAAIGDHHPGLHLVEDEDCAVVGGQLAQPLQEAGLRWHHPDVELHRLDDDRGDLTAVAFQDGGHQIGLVERRDDRLRQAAGGHPGGGGHAVGGVDRAHRLTVGLDADQQLVVVAVVAALELDDLGAPGEATRHPQGVHGGLGPGVAEAHGIDPEAALQLLRQGDSVLGREGEAGAIRHPALQGLGQDRMGVAGGKHPEGHVEVDVLVAIGIPDARAAAIGHEERIRLVGLERAGYAERHRLQRSRVQRRAAWRAGAVLGQLALEHGGHAGTVDDGVAYLGQRDPSLASILATASGAVN